MNTSRGFIFPLLMITILVTSGVAIVWWLEGQTGARAPQGAPAAEDFKVAPSEGVALLSVQFALKRDIGIAQTINYGDGTSSAVSDFICGFQYCTRMHIYSRPGVYTVSLEDAAGKALRSVLVTVTPSS